MPPPFVRRRRVPWLHHPLPRQRLPRRAEWAPHLLVVLGVIFRHRHLPEWRFAWWVSLPGWIVAAGLLYMSYTVLRGGFG